MSRHDRLLTPDEEARVKAYIKQIVERNDLTYVWLVARLKDDGVRTTAPQLCRALNGYWCGWGADDILIRAERVLRHYEDVFGGHNGKGKETERERILPASAQGTKEGADEP